MATGPEFLSKRDRTDETSGKPETKTVSTVQSGAPMLQNGENPYAVIGLKMEFIRGEIRKKLETQILDQKNLENTVELAMSLMSSSQVETIPKLEGKDAKTTLKEMATGLADRAISLMPLAMPEA